MAKKPKLTKVPEPSKRRDPAPRGKGGVKESLTTEPDLLHICESLRPLAVPCADLQFDPANAMEHPEANIAAIRASLREYQQRKPIVVNRRTGHVEAGNGFLAAALAEGKTHVAVVYVDDDANKATGYALADNRTAQLADWNDDALKLALESINVADQDLADMFTALAEAEGLIPKLDAEPEPMPEAQLDKAEELQKKWRVKQGDVFAAGPHRIICGDCREPETWAKLLGGKKVSGVFTSPPYAEQRKAQYGGTPTAEYVAWWEAVQANVRSNLAADGSFFVNIKPHCEAGERVLYVFDLVLAMKREWGWRFVDELCWKRKAPPGRWDNRLRNDFEPIYQFSTGTPSVRHVAVAYESEAVPVAGESRSERSGKHWNMSNDTAPGEAHCGNVVECTGTGSTIEHAAAFPVALPSFFVRAFSDEGDAWLDPFCGSGTTIVAAHPHGRVGYGIERLEKYVAVILERLEGCDGLHPTLADDAAEAA